MSYMGSTRTEDERLWAALAHASILLGIIVNLVFHSSWGIGIFAGPIAAFVIYTIKKDESRWVGRQAIQALAYQGVLAVIGLLVGVVSAVIAALSLGVGLVCLAPLLFIFGLLGLGFLGYGCYGAYQCYQGKNFKYYYLGDFIGGLD